MKTEKFYVSDITSVYGRQSDIQTFIEFAPGTVSMQLSSPEAIELITLEAF